MLNVSKLFFATIFVSAIAFSESHADASTASATAERNANREASMHYANDFEKEQLGQPTVGTQMESTLGTETNAKLGCSYMYPGSC